MEIGMIHSSEAVTLAVSVDGSVFAAVRRVHPGATEAECERLLWCCSAYPFGESAEIEPEIRRCWEAGGGTVDGAVGFAHAELDQAMEEFRRRDGMPI